ncbi:MAG: PD-(D/E)XK nuclease family protein [Clostridia bacterium]|nr:PD-(D/E)XK nuclease family protein [Clostridia bacterium]
MLKIYYGNESTDRENFIFDEINPDEKTILIVPDQYSLQMEKDALEYFREKTGRSALLNLMVTDFNALGHKVIKEAGGRPPELIDRYGRHMLLSVIISRLAEEGELDIYRRMGGRNTFVSHANQLISEMKRYGTGPEDIREASGETDSFLRLKLSDIEKIYTAYEEAIADRFTDTEDYMELYGKLMAESEIIKGASVWIYGFDTFTPLNMQVIAEILRAAAQVNVVMTWEEAGTGNPHDARALTTGGGEGLFELTGLVMDNLKKMAEGEGHNAKAIRIEKKRREYNPAISLVEASNIYAEADRVAAHVTELVRDRGYRYSDITVICNDMDVRGGILKRSFDRWGIPAFADRKRRVLHQPVVRFLLAFLDIIASGYEDGPIMEMVSAGLMGWSRADEELLMNYTAEARIRGNRWKRDFTWVGKSNYGDRYSEDELKRLNEMRAFISGSIEGARDEIGRRNSAGEKVRGLYEFLEKDFEIRGRIGELIAGQRELGLAEGAAETVQSWNMICGLFTQIVRVIGEENISNSQLRDVLAAGLEEMEIGLVPTSTDCVIIGTLQRTRVSHARSLIVCAANEGVLPIQPSDSGLLTQKELDRLEEMKVSITKKENVRRQEEQMAIYRTFSLPEDDLMVSCSLADQDGKSIGASGIFSVLRETSGSKVLGDLDAAGVSEMIASRRGSLSYMAEAMRGYIENGYIEEEWLSAMNWYAENDGESIGKIRQGLNFDNMVENLEQDLAEDLYFGDRDSIYMSASRLETYSGCPFRHFVERGLRADEPAGFGIDARTRGDVFHTALQELSRELTPDDGKSVTAGDSPWMTISEEECRKKVEEIIRREAAEYNEGVYLSDKASELQMERIVETCGNIAWAMIGQVRGSRTESMYFEESFGFGSKFIRPVRIELDNGKKAMLNGRIDRIDVIRAGSDEEGNPLRAVRVIDYKTGYIEVNREYIEKGYKPQLMVYMNAVVESDSRLQPAGVFYFRIGDLDINGDNEKTPEEGGASLEDRVAKECRLEGVLVNEEKVLKAMDTSLESGGKGESIPIKQMKEGDVQAYSGSELLSPEEFDELRAKAREQVEIICHEIQQGRIDIAPKMEKGKSDAGGGHRTACSYCDYKSICLFDTSFRQCRYELI